ncbi:hypothetical protein BASA81_017877 [Batrachochytrium salamandrivorans]|nr:hypothetical protein BASA81_017877 [Batrachochytrium salamandrivorans]
MGLKWDLNRKVIESSLGRRLTFAIDRSKIFKTNALSTKNIDTKTKFELVLIEPVNKGQSVDCKQFISNLDLGVILPKEGKEIGVFGSRSHNYSGLVSNISIPLDKGNSTSVVA